MALRDPDDEHRRFVFDVSFMLSDYGCIYGAGCKGVREDGPDEVVGCCAHGAYMVDDDDVALVTDAVARLAPDAVQFHELIDVDGWLDLVEPDEEDDEDEPELRTRIVDGACVFLNRDDGSGRPVGCVLHHLALEEGEHHMTHKPWVCWQLPIHREIEEQTANDGQLMEVHTIGPWERGSWGDGGADFGWWCMEAPEAFGHANPVFASMERELRTLVGDAVYDALAVHLEQRRDQAGVPRLLPLLTP